jgi:hypothetical protein
MTLDATALQRELTVSVGREIEVRPHSEGVLRVETPFAFPDGDHLVIRLREVDNHYEWSDFGHTFMHLSYSVDIDALMSGQRGRLLEQTLTRLELENRDGELVLPTVHEDVGLTLLRFVQALIHVTDLDYLSQERVRSTFRDDVRRLLKERFGARAHINYLDRKHDPRGQYPVDCLLNETDQPIAVFALLNDDNTRDATITLQEFRSWGRELFSTAIFADQEKINRRVLARFSNVCDKQFSSLAGQEDEVVAYLKKVLR